MRECPVSQHRIRCQEHRPSSCRNIRGGDREPRCRVPQTESGDLHTSMRDSASQQHTKTCTTDPQAPGRGVRDPRRRSGSSICRTLQGTVHRLGCRRRRGVRVTHSGMGSSFALIVCSVPRPVVTMILSSSNSTLPASPPRWAWYTRWIFPYLVRWISSFPPNPLATRNPRVRVVRIRSHPPSP